MTFWFIFLIIIRLAFIVEEKIFCERMLAKSFFERSFSLFETTVSAGGIMMRKHHRMDLCFNIVSEMKQCMERKGREEATVE